MRRGCRLFGLVVLGIGVLPILSPASDQVDCDGPVSRPLPFTTAWTTRDLANQWCATQRLHDQYSSPAFTQKFFSSTPDLFAQGVSSQTNEPSRLRITAAQLVPGASTADPFRSPDEWQAAGRGRVRPVSFISSFTGAKLAGEIWLPPAVLPAPYPGVVLTTGATQQHRQLYFWAAEGLAEAGYLVLTYDVQGQGGSENFNHTDDGGSFCTSRGCPGPLIPPDDYFEFGVLNAFRFLLSTQAAPYGTLTPNSQGTDLYNPQWSLLNQAVLDPSGRMRVGLIGHSLGAAYSVWTGQEDRRNAAIVSWNATGNLPDDILPKAHAPILYINSDYHQIPLPTLSIPDPLLYQAGYRQLRRLCDAGKQCVEAMQVALRASTHYEWTYVPYVRPASRYGERVSFYYTLAWLDAHLKGATDQQMRANALARLTARTFDGSADRHSIGAGLTAAGTQGFVNLPYTIVGRPVPDRLSFYYLSSHWLRDGNQTLSCEDMRAGC